MLPVVLARGPWCCDDVRALWRSDKFQPSSELELEADRAIERLRERGSPSHDGLAARLESFDNSSEGLTLTLQPIRWSLRLTTDTKDSFTVLCLVRDAAGRWLAGRRAEWVATWPGRWALGAGGSVELGENPVETIARELKEEWEIEGVEPKIEALVKHHGFVALLGQLWLPEENAQVKPDDEHDAYNWWPSEIDGWPPEADSGLKELATLFAQ